MRRLGVALALVLVLGGCDADEPPAAERAPTTGEFVTRPDLRPPVVDVTTSHAGPDSGYVCLLARPDRREAGDPQGYAMLVDTAGRPVWVERFDDDGTFPNDLAVQTYRGEPVLTYWRGSSPDRGWGNGEYVVLDRGYRRIATVRAGNGLHADLHDMVITRRNTALLLSYPTVRDEPLLREGVVQEVDIATGKVLFEWHSSDHVGIAESAAPLPPDPKVPFDYFHINSVDEDAAGNLLISARHTKAIYKIDKRTGEVLWRLGGKRSSFRFGDGAEFAWQHDARWAPGGRISLFDNTSNLDTRGGPSRALVLELDERAHTAELVSAFANPDGLPSGSWGSHRLLPGGDSLVGWGSRPGFTVFDPAGEVLLDATLPRDTFSYRAVLADWTGRPADPPRLRTGAGTTAHVSWNGATDVTGWRVLTGRDAAHLTATDEVARTGFETRLELPGPARYVAVEALDARGAVLGRSPAASTG
jgi:hypothetical protein